MKITSMFLAAVMVTAIAGQAAEARDHDGWRNQQRINLRNYNKQVKRQQQWNNRVWRNNGWNTGYYNSFNGNSRPWDNMHDNSIRALQEIRRMQQAQQGYGYWY